VVAAMGVCSGSIAMLVFLLLVVVAPGSVLGGRTRLLLDERGAVVVSTSTSNSSVGIGSAGPGFHSVRKLLAQPRRPMEAAAAGIHPPPVDDQASKSVPPAPPARQSRFALLFRSLAKGSPTPTPGTPSPGHN